MAVLLSTDVVVDKFPPTSTLTVKADPPTVPSAGTLFKMTAISLLSLCLLLTVTAVDGFVVPSRGFQVHSQVQHQQRQQPDIGLRRSSLDQAPHHDHLLSRTRRFSSSSEQRQNDLPAIPYLTVSVPSEDRSNDLQIGEDAGVFDIRREEWGRLGEKGWATFTAAVAAILTAVAVLWVIPSTGYSDDFVHFLEHDVANGNPHIVTLVMGIIFPIVHSGLASLRPYGEQVVGARIWRVIFAFPSLCLAYTWIVYFIGHVHSGIEFYDISHNPVAHAVAFIINYVSFFFLYPSVFNLKEVAAVEPPTLHLWETGIIRITRHPQFVGQSMWSAAHLAMVGTSFTALTMALLVGHHAFACWNGDRRYRAQFGDQFDMMKERTSIIPFQAVWEGRQVLPKDYYKELLRGPYLVIAIGTLGAYFAHPYMQGGAALVQNTGWVEGGIFG